MKNKLHKDLWTKILCIKPNLVSFHFQQVVGGGAVVEEVWVIKIKLAQNSTQHVLVLELLKSEGIFEIL